MANANTATATDSRVSTETLPVVTKTVGTDELIKADIREGIDIPRDLEIMIIERLKVACLMVHTGQSSLEVAADSLFKGLNEDQSYAFARATVVQQLRRLVQGTKKRSLDNTINDSLEVYGRALLVKKIKWFNALPKAEQKTALTEAGQAFLKILSA